MNDRRIYTDTSQIFTDIGNGIPFNGSSGGFHPKITARKKNWHTLILLDRPRPWWIMDDELSIKIDIRFNVSMFTPCIRVGL